MLTATKLLHTVIWAVLVACILGLPVAGVSRRFRWTGILSVIVLVECGLLAINGGRCPLSDLAARFTVDRGPNFDIFLPAWLAQRNKVIFGSVFVVGELVVIGCWLRERFAISPRAASNPISTPSEGDHSRASS